MKKDEEVFQLWFEEERSLFESREPATYTDSDEWCMKKGWIAACNYKQQEINELQSEKDLAKETIVELKSEIARLLRKLAIDSICNEKGW